MDDMPPASFAGDVRTAAAAGELGRLRLLRWESQGFAWSEAASDWISSELAARQQTPAYARAIVFSGHRVDEPHRPVARFPLDMQARAKRAIRNAVERIAGSDPASCLGVAGAAAGGDILFHEVCTELAVPSRAFLTLPRDAYLEPSVTCSAGEWTTRFDAILERAPTKVLSESSRLPAWLSRDPSYIWGRTNLWMLEEALTLARDVHLMVLWNGAPGDGPGGTGHLVELAQERSMPVTILSTKELFA